MKTLPGQALHESDYASIEKQLRALFYELVFQPVVRLLAPRNAQVRAAAKELKNSSDLRNAKYDPIVSGIHSGRVQYVDGVFSGDFSASISRALREYGAKFNKRTGTFSIIPEALPFEVTAAAAEYAETAELLHEKLMETLNAIQHGLERAVSSNPVDASVTIGKLDKKFSDKYRDAIGTEDLSDIAKDELKEAYAAALKPYIESFSEEMISDLRGIVTENAKAGYRFDNLVTKIQNRYDVSQSKAEFLAQQETGLFMAAHRQARFGDVGIRKYIWRTAGDSTVRDSHKKLNGRVFEYSKPPVVDEATGRRANPGQDFRCRCEDEPVLPEVLTDA